FQELKIVTHPEVQGEVGRRLPLVLRIKSDVWIGLRDDRIAEGLGKAQIVVDPLQKIIQRRERIAAANGARIGNGGVVEEEVYTGTKRMRSCLVREVVHNLIEIVASGC